VSMNRVTFYDVSYDDALQDLETSAGDLAAFKNTHTEHMDQLLKDALESQFNSMKHIMRNWGFEGRTDDYTTTDNVPKQKAYLFMGEILNVISPLFLNIRAISPTFTATGFTFRIEAVLTDIAKTEYDKQLSFNQTTKRATVV